MAENLLLDLETTAPVAESLEHIEALLREAMSHETSIASAVEGLKGSARSFENAWKRIVLAVAGGQTAEMQGARSRLLIAFETRLRLLRETHDLAVWLRARGSVQIQNPSCLLMEVEGMEHLKGRVFDRWQSSEDLEDLAARDYPLTTADLERIGPQRRPPASFYAEESKPF